MRLIFILLLASCATSQVSRPITYSGITGKCPLVYLEFNSYPGYNCYCRVEGEAGSHMAYVYIPVRSHHCRPDKTEIKEVE